MTSLILLKRTENCKEKNELRRRGEEGVGEGIYISLQALQREKAKGYKWDKGKDSGLYGENILGTQNVISNRNVYKFNNCHALNPISVHCTAFL